MTVLDLLDALRGGRDTGGRRLLLTTMAPMSYWADSAFLAAAGIPTVLYGPEGEGAHADIAWVSRPGTSTAAAVLTQLAHDFCRTRRS